MISHLETADILIDLQDGIPTNAMIYLHRLTDMYSKENISLGHRLYRGDQGSITRVTSTALRANLRGSLVFRLQDSVLKANLMRIVSGWENLKEERKKPSSSTHQLIPFVMQKAKPATPTLPIHASENIIQFTSLTRHNHIPFPSQFVSFSLKAAILKTLFPYGFPEEIKRKLDKKYLMPSDTEANAYLHFLYEPIKGKTVSDFTKMILEKYQDIFMLVGSLGYVRELTRLDPVILTPPALAELTTNDLLLTPENFAELEAKSSALFK